MLGLALAQELAQVQDRELALAQDLMLGLALAQELEQVRDLVLDLVQDLALGRVQDLVLE